MFDHARLRLMIPDIRKDKNLPMPQLPRAYFRTSRFNVARSLHFSTHSPKPSLARRNWTKITSPNFNECGDASHVASLSQCWSYSKVISCRRSHILLPIVRAKKVTIQVSMWVDVITRHQWINPQPQLSSLSSHFNHSHIECRAPSPDLRSRRSRLRLETHQWAIGRCEAAGWIALKNDGFLQERGDVSWLDDDHPTHPPDINGGSHKHWYPKWLVYFMEISMKKVTDAMGVPLIISGNHH